MRVPLVFVRFSPKTVQSLHDCAVTSQFRAVSPRFCAVFTQNGAVTPRRCGYSPTSCSSTPPSHNYATLSPKCGANSIQLYAGCSTFSCNASIISSATWSASSSCDVKPTHEQFISPNMYVSCPFSSVSKIKSAVQMSGKS